MDVLTKLRQSFKFFCIPRQSNPGKVTQEFISLLMENRNSHNA